MVQTFFACSNSTSVAAATASRFLKPLAIRCGADASVGYLIASEIDAMRVAPCYKTTSEAKRMTRCTCTSLLRRSSEVMSSTRGSKMAPDS